MKSDVRFKGIIGALIGSYHAIDGGANGGFFGGSGDFGRERRRARFDG